MEVHEVPVTAPISTVKHSLTLQEQLVGDERLMAPREQLTFVRQHTRVVRVTKNLRQSARRQWPRRALIRGACRQPQVFELASQLPDGALPRRILFEGPPNQRAAIGIDGNGVHEPTVELLSNVEVSEFRAADCPAIHRFVPHLLLDVFAALADLDLVHDVGNGFHGVRHVALAEVLLGRDEFDTHPGQDSLGDGRVSKVPESA